jgi:geranyl-CoA carboxylase alpha subunit
LPLLLRYAVDGRECSARIVRTDATRLEVESGSARRSLEVAGLHASHARLTLEGVQDRVDFHRDGAVLWLHHAGRTWRVEDLTRAPARRAGASGQDGRVRASTSGRVAAVRVGVGERVETGSPLVVLEAMKIEHLHLAPVSGTVVALHVEVGAQVAAGRVLAEIVAEAPGGGLTRL